MGIDISQERVTPKKAEEWLNANNVNRRLDNDKVTQYANDMRDGRWTSCAAPICFYDDGNIADGQHRLWAVVEAGSPMSFIIARGFSREDGLNIDRGKPRSLVDNAKISGSDVGLTNELIGVCRAIEDGQHANSTNRSGSRLRSDAERLAIVAKHREAADWAISNGPRGKGIRTAMLTGAVARAWYFEADLDRLRRFGDVVTDGFSDGDAESAAVAFRNYLIHKSSATSSALWRDTFLKAQNAIYYFMQGRRLTVIKSVNSEQYPLKAKRRT